MANHNFLDGVGKWFIAYRGRKVKMEEFRKLESDKTKSFILGIVIQLCIWILSWLVGAWP